MKYCLLFLSLLTACSSKAPAPAPKPLAALYCSTPLGTVSLDPKDATVSASEVSFEQDGKEFVISLAACLRIYEGK